MRIDPRPIYPGDRVKVFDTRLYVNDKKTPLTETMQSATVIRRYGMPRSPEAKYGPYPDLVDVVFDRDGKESKSHFTDYVAVIEYRNL